MSTPAKRKIMRDMKRILDEPLEGIIARPNRTNIMDWRGIIYGPEDTPFEGGVFKLKMSFDEAYPQHPPEVSFISRVYHPNVYPSGELCLDILKNKWSPTYDIGAVLLSVQSLLNDPNISSPANSEAAGVFASDKREYRKRVRESVEDSWAERGEYKERGGRA
jgi:ubiquitin-protein ligase